MKYEFRSGAYELRASVDSAEELRFEGYAALFDTWSEDLGGFVERIAKGAFKDALGDDVRALVNHDPNYVLGRNKAGTLELVEDERGLWFSVIAPNTQWARDLKKSVERGDVNQCSFGFSVDKEHWDWSTDGTPNKRTLTGVRLFDVSIVTYPAYQATTVHARSAADVLEAASMHKARDEPKAANTLLKKQELYEKLYSGQAKD